MTIDQLLTQYGLPLASLIIVLVTGSRGIWVWGRELKSTQIERDEWKRIALSSLDVTKNVLPNPE